MDADEDDEDQDEAAAEAELTRRSGPLWYTTCPRSSGAKRKGPPPHAHASVRARRRRLSAYSTKRATKKCVSSRSAREKSSRREGQPHARASAPTSSDAADADANADADADAKPQVLVPVLLLVVVEMEDDDDEEEEGSNGSAEGPSLAKAAEAISRQAAGSAAIGSADRYVRTITGYDGEDEDEEGEGEDEVEERDAGAVADEEYSKWTCISENQAQHKQQWESAPRELEGIRMQK